MERREMLVHVAVDHGEMTVQAVFDEDGVLQEIEPAANSGLPERVDRCDLTHETITKINRMRDNQIEDEDNRARE